MLAGQERAATALIAGLGTADLTVRGLAERASAQRTTAVDVGDVVRRGSTSVQPGTIPLRLALDPQDLLERRLIHRERHADSEQTGKSYISLDHFLQASPSLRIYCV